MLFDVQATLHEVNAEALVRRLAEASADMSGVIILDAIRAERRRQATKAKALRQGEEDRA